MSVSFFHKRKKRPYHLLSDGRGSDVSYREKITIRLLFGFERARSYEDANEGAKRIKRGHNLGDVR